MEAKLVINMEIINYGHACFAIKNEKITIVLDPYAIDSVPGLKLANNIEANYVFTSHNHADHNAVNLINIVPVDEKINVIKVELPHDKVGGSKRGMSLAHIFDIDGLKICHMGDIGDANAVIKSEELKDLDIVLCPINGFFTISAMDAINLQKKMNWKVLIPMHYEKKLEGSGYPDGGQIEVFSKNMNKIKYVDDVLEVNEELFNYDAVIFNKRNRGN